MSPRSCVVVSGDANAQGERLSLPLNAAGEHFGTLELVGDSFTEEQRLNAALLAAQAVVALENARLHGMVERQALVDGLTGLANRRACSDALQGETARAERLGTPFSVVLVDLDGFKDVNDAHGHAVGDGMLRAFADVLRETLRESDVAGRWGGEEFLLLLPGADEEGAAQLAELMNVSYVHAAVGIPRGVPPKQLTDAAQLHLQIVRVRFERRTASHGRRRRSLPGEARWEEPRRASRPGRVLTLPNRKPAAIPVIMRADDEYDPWEDASCR